MDISFFSDFYTRFLPYLTKMESWLDDVKRVRIPRPKFERKYPAEPPKDYLEDCSDLSGKGRHHHDNKDLAKATEDLRRTLQEKLWPLNIRIFSITLFLSLRKMTSEFSVVSGGYYYWVKLAYWLRIFSRSDGNF